MSDNFTDWYNEDKDQLVYKGSKVEIFMFYLSMGFIILFGVLVLACCKFQPKFLLSLIPLPIWMFLRCSRKDMSATAYLIAGLFGAFGGALVVILERIFRVVGK